MKYYKTNSRSMMQAAMPIERAHRIGRNRRGNPKPRPIVVKFLRYPDLDPDKELVKRSASKLKGTSIGINVLGRLPICDSNNI